MATTPQRRNRIRRSSGRPTLGETRLDEEMRDMVVDALTNSRKDYESRVLEESEMALTGATASFSGDFIIENPPYNLQALAALVDRSNILRQCIDAYVTNIESTGHALQYIGPEGQEESPQAKAEAERINALLDDPNGDYSLIEMRERTRRDMESIGAYALEVVRSPDGSIQAVYHTPAHTLYLTRKDATPVSVTRWARRNGQPVAITRMVRFRRIVQQVSGKKLYFKEFGDPRSIDPDTGRETKNLSPDKQATEILYVPLYKSGYTYGVPRYIHQLPSIQGSREAELTNLQFFKDNAIPAMVILLSGGSLTTETHADIAEFITRAKGRDAQHKVLTLEALADTEAAAQNAALQPPKLDIKPLGNERQQDALFQEYDRENQKKVRSAFRLNPLFVGLSEDMTYATAKASLEMSEAQVFGPERNKVDDIINMKLLQDSEGKPPLYWWVKSNPPRIVDPQDVIQSLEKFGQAGAMTPNVAISVANEVFGLTIPPITDPWGDVPFAITTTLLGQKAKIKGLENIASEPPPPDPPPMAPGQAPGAQAGPGGTEPPAQGGSDPDGSQKALGDAVSGAIKAEVQRAGKTGALRPRNRRA